LQTSAVNFNINTSTTFSWPCRWVGDMTCGRSHAAQHLRRSVNPKQFAPTSYLGSMGI